MSKKDLNLAGSINYNVCETISTFQFCKLKKVEINLDVNFEARCTENYAIFVFLFNCIPLQNRTKKCPFCLRTNNSFFFLCLRTSKILSLGEFDELKSHLFLVHFSV